MGFLGPVKKGLLEELGAELDPRGNVKTDENYIPVNQDLAEMLQYGVNIQNTEILSMVPNMFQRIITSARRNKPIQSHENNDECNYLIFLKGVIRIDKY